LRYKLDARSFAIVGCYFYICAKLFLPLQGMKYFFEETKLEVKQIQSEWEEEFSRLGNHLRIGFPYLVCRSVLI